MHLRVSLDTRKHDEEQSKGDEDCNEQEVEVNVDAITGTTVRLMISLPT